ncbi:glycosyltransferase family 4 protein [Rubellicoccus peritrichatus]|uniref:Glycosyltransferase family 4 protein n=1 Tax=Rubellicoccus peritrichatus TaxID=3080537 RepID=A0AAQ3LCU1_9BACT|nr:glycosyltransferase family 4 protein [Puniceicoccus sp. CR14]WOO42112.1 glycosyltransferase family 4 protein [Puniceicoccus sp. CR14]
MKVLLYSPVFWPSVGGVEAITETLGIEMTTAGIDCYVVTETESEEQREYPFRVIRKPTIAERFRLTSWCDIIHSNSASVAMWPYAELLRKPFIWTHNGYQAACIDGLGWEAGKPAPIAPIPSFWHHWKVNGAKSALIGGLKLVVRRHVALNHVALNIPATRWVDKRLALPRSVQAYTPYPNKNFLSPTGDTNASSVDFLYVGRLVTEKGVNTLIEALALLSKAQGSQPTLRIVGGGPEKDDLESLAQELKVRNQIEFTGPLSGDALRKAISEAAIAIVPSIWEEPMGGVTLELLSAGKCLIVSEKGGHAEVCGKAALTFLNGNPEALANQMDTLINDPEQQTELRSFGKEKLTQFSAKRLTNRYIQIYNSVIQEVS